jgi:hypothetical protein
VRSDATWHMPKQNMAARPLAHMYSHMSPALSPAVRQNSWSNVLLLVASSMHVHAATGFKQMYNSTGCTGKLARSGSHENHKTWCSTRLEKASHALPGDTTGCKCKTNASRYSGCSRVDTLPASAIATQRQALTRTLTVAGAQHWRQARQAEECAAQLGVTEAAKKAVLVCPATSGSCIHASLGLAES